jgi:hypothetical protein
MARIKRRRKPLPSGREVTVTLTRHEWTTIGQWLRDHRHDEFCNRVREVLRAMLAGKGVEGAEVLPDWRIALTRPLDSFRLMCSRLLPRDPRAPAADGFDPLYRQVLACNLVGETGGDPFDDDDD